MNIHKISATNKLINQMYTSDSENLIKKLRWVTISWIILKEWENWSFKFCNYHIMVSYDIVSLFTNVPLEETI